MTLILVNIDTFNVSITFASVFHQFQVSFCFLLYDFDCNFKIVVFTKWLFSW